MIRAAVLLVSVLLLTAPAADAAGSEQIKRSVERELRQYGFRNVDVDTLTTSQIAAIHNIAGFERRSGRRGAIRSVLNGPYSLRGLFR